jgi:hypothetical protein
LLPFSYNFYAASLLFSGATRRKTWRQRFANAVAARRRAGDHNDHFSAGLIFAERKHQQFMAFRKMTFTPGKAAKKPST